jgi:hypothetical protein
MDAVSEHSFKIDLDSGEDLKPLPYVRRTKGKNKRLGLPNTYPKFEVEFYDCISDVAQMIDRVTDRDARVKFHQELTKIFAIRHKGSVMRLYREIFNTLNSTREGENHGQKIN